MIKKSQIVFAMLLIVIMTLTACGAKPTPTAAPATEAPTTAATEVATAAPTEAPTGPVYKDIVLVALPGGQSMTTFTKNFNPFTSQSLYPTLNGIYEPLMIYNKVNGEVVPWLATEYKWSDDKLTLTFTIREGVKWSDGTAFTAGDVAYTFNLMKGNNALSGIGQNAVGTSGYVSAVAATDDKTVAFTFSKVFLPGVYDIIQQDIVPEHIWTNIADPVKDINDNPVGTGPFTELVDFQDQAYELDRNPNYWQEGKPYFKGIRMPAFADNGASANMMINGEADWADQFYQNLQEAVLDKNPDLECWWPTANVTQVFAFNDTVAPFDDVNFRKAISMAFDREKITKIAMNGAFVPTDLTGLPDAYAGYRVSDISTLGDNWVVYDPDKANQMLDAAGYTVGADGFRTNKDGSPMELEFMQVNGFSDWLAAAPIMKQELDALHLKIVMNTYDAGVAFDKWFKGDFQMSLTFTQLGTPTVYAWFADAMSAATMLPNGTPSTFGVNIWRYADPRIETFIEILATNTDEQAQKNAAVEMQKLFAEDAPFIPMWASAVDSCWSNKTFAGWPTENNPYTSVGPSVNGAVEQLIVMTTIYPK
jgi:peptide/nickel transport system substrate-binding protein